MEQQLRENAVSSALATYLRAELDRRNWTASVLSERSGVPKGNLSKILRNPDHEPEVPTLIKLARGLDVPIREIMAVCGYDMGDITVHPDTLRRAIVLEKSPELKQTFDLAMQLPAEDQQALLVWIEARLDRRVRE